MSAATAPSVTRRPSTPVDDAPFPGLEHFSEEQSAYFFGRDRDRKIITSNLEGSKLTLLYGASGVGKSSVLLAGVVHQLRRRALADLRTRAAGEEAPFAVTAFRSWPDRPLPLLMEHIRLAAVEALGGADAVADEPLEPWREGERPADRLREWTQRVRYLYVVLDQFEEYFLYHAASDEDGSFDVELARIVNDPQLRVDVLISLREDALALLDRFKAKIPRLLENYYRVDHLELDAARDAIRKPVLAYNELHDADVDVEEALVEALVEAKELRSSRTLGADAPVRLAGGDGKPRIETPYLQLVLRRLWDTERARGSNVLRKRTLDDLGGPRKIVESHLQQAIDALEQDEQELAVDLFRYLVTPSKSKIAYTPDDLAGVAEKPVEAIAPLLQKLTASWILRRTVTAGEAADGVGARYEIVHDVLAEPILAWRSQRVADRHEREEREAAARELEHARATAHRNRRRAVVSYVLTALSALALAGVAVLGWQALQSRDVARSQKLAAAAMSSLAWDPNAGVRLSLDALAHRRTPEAESALRTLLPASRLRTVLPGGSFVSSVAVGGAHDELVAMGNRAGRVRVWDWRTKREVVPALRETDWVTTLRFSADAHRLLSLGCCGRSSLTVWDVQKCRRTKSCDVFRRTGNASSSITAATLSSDGRFIAIGEDSKAEVWRVDRCPARSCSADVTMNALGSGSAYAWVNALAFGTGHLLAAGASDGTVSVWRVSGRRHVLLHRMHTSWSTGVVSIAISPGGRFLAAAGDETAFVFDLGKCDPAPAGACGVTKVARTRDWLNTVSFGTDPNTFVTASEDGVVRVWEVTAAEPLIELRGHADTVFDASFSPDGNYVVSGSADRTARVWWVGTGKAYRYNSKWVDAAYYSPDGAYIGTAGADGTARLFARDGSEAAVLLVTAPKSVLTIAERARVAALGTKLPSRPTIAKLTNNIAFSPNGSQLATADDAGHVRVWDLAACRAAFVCVGGRELAHDDTISSVGSVAFSHDGRLLATADGWSGARVVDAASGKVLANVGAGGDNVTLDVAFSPTSDYLAVTSTGAASVVTIWDVSSCHADARCAPRRVGKLPHKYIVYVARFSHDGTMIATGSGDRRARVWTEWLTPRPRAVEFAGHTSNVRSVAFDGADRRLVTTGADGTTRVWDVRTQQQLAVLTMHADLVGSAEFDPRNGSTIMSAGNDHAVRVYRCPTCGTLDEVRDAAAAREDAIARPVAWLPGDGPRG